MSSHSASTLPPAQRPETFASPHLTPKLHLYLAPTANGHKAPILLEELHDVYPDMKELVYDFHHMNLGDERDQKKPEYIAINPNGRIPALVDDNAGGHKVWESGSILLWLVDRYDRDYHFSFEDYKLRQDMVSWTFWSLAGVGPQQGQAIHFNHYAPEHVPYAIKRYQDETLRLYSVMEDRLRDPESKGWLVGGKYSVADINLFSWVRGYAWAGIDITPFPHIQKWLDTIEARPAVLRGLEVPVRGRKSPNE